MAFGLRPMPSEEKSCWGTHFGPSIEMGSGTKIPDIAAVDGPMIDYWQRRMAEARHPVCSARYADLVWDLSGLAAGWKRPVEAARAAVDAYGDAAERATAATLHQAQDRLERGLEIALSIGDTARTERMRDGLLSLQGRFPRWHAWVRLLELLGGNPRIGLTHAQREYLLHGMEGELARAEASATGAGSIELKGIALCLAAEYGRQDRGGDVERVLKVWGGAVERLATGADGMMALGWLTDVHSVYRDHAMRDDAERVLIATKEKGADAERTMPRMTASVGQDPQEFEEFLTHMTSGTVEETLQRIALDFLPRVEDSREAIAEVRRSHPLLAMIGQAKIADGQIVGRAGSAHDDEAGQIILEMAQRIGFSAQLLRPVIDRARQVHGLSTEQILGFLNPSGLFDDDDRELLGEGLDAYASGDHVKAIHVLIPRIEAAVRRLLAGLGGATNKAWRGQTVMTEKTLNELLERESLLADFLGEDIVTYLRVLLVDPLGHNARNRLCHGLQPRRAFNRELSDRLVHVLLLLGLVRPEDTSTKDAEA